MTRGPLVSASSRTYGLVLGLGCLLLGGLPPGIAHAATDSLFTAQRTGISRAHPTTAETSRLLATDRWWARDKAQHVAFSFLWTLGTQYVLVNKADWSESDALPASVGVTVTVGLSKEFYDWRIGPTGRFSGKDLAANAVGILAAVGVILL